MAYDKRNAELQDGLKSAAGTQEHTRRVLSDALNRYADLRRAALDDLVSLIDGAVVGTTGTPDKWVERVNRARADLERLIGDVAKEDLLLPSPGLFWDATVRAERTFWETLGPLDVPQRVEALLNHQGRLSKMIADLDRTWTDQLAASRSLNADERRDVEQLDRLVQDLIGDLQSKYRAPVSEFTVKIKETTQDLAARTRQRAREALGDGKAADAVEGAARLGAAVIWNTVRPYPSEAQPVLDKLAAGADQLTNDAAHFSQLYRAAADDYRGLMSRQQGGVLTLFKGTRDAVAEYRKNSDLVTARIQAIDEVARTFDHWWQALVAAQRDDGEEFADKIEDLVHRDWEVTEALDRQFQDKFRGIFTAELSTDTLEALTERYLTRQALDDVHRAVAALDETQQQLTGAAAGAVEAALVPLEAMDTDWPDDLRVQARLSNAEFRTFVSEQLKRHVDAEIVELIRIRTVLTAADEALSRSALEEWLLKR